MDLNKDIILELYPEFTSVLGPYKRADGRKHIILNNKNKAKGEKGKTRTISFPKALVESYINRRLEEDETVDHIDRDINNNKLDNLRIINRSEHVSYDVLRVSVGDVICPICGTSFTPTVNQRNSKLDKAGPFCSRSCIGKYGKSIQEGNDKITRTKINKTYYKKQ